MRYVSNEFTEGHKGVAKRAMIIRFGIIKNLCILTEKTYLTNIHIDGVFGVG